jgi:hypothetical protein
MWFKDGFYFILLEYSSDDSACFSYIRYIGSCYFFSRIFVIVCVVGCYVIVCVEFAGRLLTLKVLFAFLIALFTFSALWPLLTSTDFDNRISLFLLSSSDKVKARWTRVSITEFIYVG